MGLEGDQIEAKDIIRAHEPFDEYSDALRNDHPYQTG